jgi:hypothetical protein
VHVIDDPERHQAEQEWLGGGSALPLVRLHISRGELLEAAVVARAALETPGCADAAAIEEILYQLDEAPPDWEEILRAFAAGPTVERWREIMRFVPEDIYYHRVRNSIRRLRQLGTNPDILFLCACDLGMTPDAIALVEDGLVSAAVIEERASAAGGARATYLGLAATAAYLAGDLVGAIRLLRESAGHENVLCSPLPHIYFIRERASGEENALLDKAGIPAV